jgi:hypothetical protein
VLPGTSWQDVALAAHRPRDLVPRSVDWQPLDRATLESWIADALATRDDAVRAAWAHIRIEPEKWQCSPRGDAGGGFWALAVEGDRVTWFNDVENRFVRSRFAERGVIAAYVPGIGSFDAIVERLAQAISEREWRRLAPSGLPHELAGPGTIVAHQSTYWDLRTDAGAIWRVHLRDRAEARVVTARYASPDVVAEHPVLEIHMSPRRSVYFAGHVDRPHVVAEALARAVLDASAGWRDLAAHRASAAAIAASLATGHGFLLAAPDAIAVAVASALEAAGVSASVVGTDRARPPLQALVAGDSFVIAEAFAFERTA